VNTSSKESPKPLVGELIPLKETTEKIFDNFVSKKKEWTECLDDLFLELD